MEVRSDDAALTAKIDEASIRWNQVKHWVHRDTSIYIQRYFCSALFFSSHNTVHMIWLGLGTNITWLGLEKHHVLSPQTHLQMVQRPLRKRLCSVSTDVAFHQNIHVWLSQTWLKKCLQKCLPTLFEWDAPLSIGSQWNLYISWLF